MATRLNNYLNIEGAYCGHQFWWGDGSVGNYFGCGVTAALDGMLYRLGYGKTLMDQKTYLKMAEEMWQIMRPNTGLKFRKPMEVLTGSGIGVYLPWQFRKGIARYALAKGYSIHFRQQNNTMIPWKKAANLEKAIDFIEESLQKEEPVHLLSYRNQSHGYSFHWVTITGIEKVAKGHRITVATWGRRYDIDCFEDLWQSHGLLQNRYLVTYTIGN